MRNYLLLMLSIAYVLGIIVVNSLWPALFLQTALGVILMTCTILFRRNTLLVFFLLAFLLGSVNTATRLFLADKQDSALRKSVGPISGTIDAVRQKERALLLDVSVKQPRTGLTLLVTGARSATPSIGQELTVQPPFAWQPRNNKGNFLVIPAAQITFGPRHWSIGNILNGINQRCYRVHQRTLPPPYDALLTGLIFGNSTTTLSPEINNAYQRTGVIHLLVVSGAQVALLLTVFTRLCSVFRLSRPLAFILSTLFNLFFVLLTGAGPSISRAGLMAEFALLARLSGRAQHFYTTLALSGVSLLILDPLCLYQIGFQLSFLATFALFYVAPILEERLKPYCGRWAEPLSIALGPLLLSTPLIAFYFNRISLIALPANLFVAMIIELLVVSGFLSTVLGLIGVFPLALVLNQGNLVLLVIMNKLIFYLSDLSCAQINVRSPSLLALIIFYGIIFITLEKWRKRLSLTGKQIVTGIIVLGLVFLVPGWFAGGIRSPLQITVIDVGQGDAFLIETPQQKKILIDGGPFMKGERSAFQYLAARGVNDVDGIILTHDHADHINGLLPVLENINVHWVVTSGFQGNSSAYKKFIYMIKKKKIPWHQLYRGAVIHAGPEVELDILSPSEKQTSRSLSNENERSLVCRLVYKDFSMLFTGDAGEISEHTILAAGVSVNSAVLKAGHHGSRWATSAPFLATVMPNTVIVPCGIDNKFGHPHQEFLQRIEKMRRMTQRNIPLYRTDQQGTIIIGTDGHTYTLTSSKHT